MTFPWLVAGVLGIAVIAGVAARYTRAYGTVATSAAAGILLLQYWYFGSYTSDDAYISYRYARNLADGLGPVWNSGERVEGYTNFLWVAMLAGLSKAGGDVVLGGRWLGFAFAVAASGGTYALTRDLTEAASRRSAGLVAVLLLAASGPWALWATAGLEVPLFGALIIAAVLLHLRERDGWPPASGLVWGVAAMARPDALLLVTLSGAWKVGELVQSVRAGGRLAPEAARLAVWVAGFAVVFVPYFAWRWGYYGWPLPNTYYAKVGSGFDQYERGLEYISLWATEYAAAFLLLVPVAIVAGVMRRAPASYILTLLVAWLAYIAYVGGDSLLRCRFIAPVTPLFYALVVASAASLIEAALDRGRAPQAWARVAVLATVVLAALAFTMRATADDAVGIRGERRAVEDREEVGRWLRSELSASTSVAAVPIGAIGYESRLELIDMLGITDEHIAHRDLAIGAFAAGHEKYDSDYVIGREPDIILLIDRLTATPSTGADYDGLRRVIIPGVVDMMNNPGLASMYERRAVEIDEGRWLNLLVRKDARDVRAVTIPAPE